MGRSQSEAFIPALESRLQVEENKEVKKAIREALAISLLANGNRRASLDSVKDLAEMKSIPSRAFLEAIIKKEVEAEQPNTELVKTALACQATLVSIEKHIEKLEFFGSFFRGFSTGSVLLIVSFGLAITFGLMGVINMAHGEFVAIGGYTTFPGPECFYRYLRNQ